MDLQERLHQMTQAWGADYFGVADLSPAREAIFAQGGDVVAGFPCAISLGIVLMHSIVDGLPRRAERALAVSYRHHAYDVVNRRLDEIASRLSSALQREGYHVLPIPAAERADDERLCAIFSHKLAAHLAGLGWIGKNCLLITPEVGPRVRWITVLTDAPLTPAAKPLANRCGKCRECADACPAQAIAGRAFREADPRERRLDARACEKQIADTAAATGLRICGMCLYVCPWGRKASARLQPVR